MLLLKQSTAVTVLIGPFLDDTDGITAETALTISQADVRLSKNGGNMAQKNNGTSCTHDELGYYTCPLSTTDTNTLGILKVMVSESGTLPVWHEFMVVPANVYDSLVGGSDYLQVDTVQIEGSDATNLVNAEVDSALADYDPPTKSEMDSGLASLNDLDTAGVRTAVGMSSANLDSQLAALPTAAENRAEIDSNSTQLAAILTDTGTDIPALIAALNDLSAAQVNAEVDSALADYDPPTKAELDSGLAGLNDPTAPQIAQAVLSEGVSNVEDDADTDSLAASLLMMLKSAVSGSTLTIYKTDGVTVFTTRTVSTDSGADPITGVS